MAWSAQLSIAAALLLAAPLWTCAQTSNTAAFQSSRKLVCSAGGGGSGTNGGSGTFAPSPGGLSFPSTPFGLNTDTFNSKVVTSGDLDNDGDPDVLHAYLNRTDAHVGGIVEWWENVGGGGSSQFARRAIVVTGSLASPADIHDAALADMDSDGDLDVVLLLYQQTAYVAWEALGNGVPFFCLLLFLRWQLLRLWTRTPPPPPTHFLLHLIPAAASSPFCINIFSMLPLRCLARGCVFSLHPSPVLSAAPPAPLVKL